MMKIPLVEDSKVKSGGCIFAVRSDGEVTGHKQPAGYLIPHMQGELKSSLVFITCPNQTTRGRYCIGFCSENTKFNKMKDGPLVNVSLIVVKGMIYDECAIKVVFHRWKGKGCCNNLHEELLRYKCNANAFVQQFFNPEPEAVDIDEIDIAYVNQILGRRLDDWSQEPSVFKHIDGHYYYKAKTQPGSFCQHDPFPDSKRYNYLDPPTYRDKINNISLQKAHKHDETAKYIGSPKLRLHKDSTTKVVYALPQDNTSAFGKFNKPIGEGKKKKVVRPLFQVMPSCLSSDSKVTLSPISKEDRELVAAKCREQGGWVTPEVLTSEINKYTNKFGAKSIEVEKISLNKVSNILRYQFTYHIISYVCNGSYTYIYISYHCMIICI